MINYHYFIILNIFINLLEEYFYNNNYLLMIITDYNEKTTIKETTDADYQNIINILYGLNATLTFKDNNKYNLSSENVIVSSVSHY